MAIEIKDGGTYRIYPIRLQGVALNAYGSSATTSGQNVCLYKDTPSDTMQDWIIRAVDLDEGSYQIHSANNTEFVLDRSNGVLRTSRNNNAHLCELSGTDLNDSEVMITTPAGDSQGHVFIKLKAAINGQVLYLTSTNYSSSDSTPSSITSSMALNTNGNVYWAPQSSAIRAYQYWRLEKQDDSGETPTPNPEPAEGVTVTGIPYNSSSETFHPQSGMVSGSWATNNGAEKAAAIKRLYEGVFNLSSSSPGMYMYNIFGKKYPDSLTNYNKLFHTGIDMDNYRNAPVYSYCDGEVVRDGTSDGYKTVGIYDASKKVTFYYLHMTDVPDLSVGSNIKKGDLIGYQFSSGLNDPNGTVDHLHVEVHKGRYTGYPAHLPLINEELVTVSPYQYL